MLTQRIGLVLVSTGVVVVDVKVVPDREDVSAAELPSTRRRADGEVGAVASPHAASTSTAPPKKTAFFQLMLPPRRRVLRVYLRIGRPK